MINETTGQAVGFVHLYEAKVDRKKVLTVPGIEPSTEFLGSVKAKELYPYIEKALQDVAKRGGYQAIYLPTNDNILTNRSDIQKLIKQRNYPTRTLPQAISWNRVPTPYPFSEMYVIDLRPDLPPSAIPDLPAEPAADEKQLGQAA